MAIVIVVFLFCEMENSGLDSDMPSDPPHGASREAWIPRLLSSVDSDKLRLFCRVSFRLPLVNPQTSPIQLERIDWIDLRGYWTNTPREILLLSLELGSPTLSSERNTGRSG